MASRDTTPHRFVVRGLLGLAPRPSSSRPIAQTPAGARVGAGDIICWGTTVARVLAVLDVTGTDVCLCETPAGPRWVCWDDGTIDLLEHTDAGDRPDLPTRTVAGGRAVAAGRSAGGGIWVRWGQQTWTKPPGAASVPALWVPALGPHR